MIPLAKLEEHLRHLTKENIEIVLEIRNIVAELCPDAVERLDRNGIVYYDASRGGSVKGGICMLLFKEDHIRIDFPHGAYLNDPSHLLNGVNLAKWGADLAPHYDDIPWDEIAALITASAIFDPCSLPQNQKPQ